MKTIERKAVISLSLIMGLRMLGLFMVLPVFSLYAQSLPGATPTLIGLSMGIYGLFQALFQIPFGSLSDRFGRKPIITLGLIIFALGSLVAGFAQSILIMILGRALQGMGAIGSTTLAMLSDLTREEERTKTMAIAGITIGFSFSVAILLGPLLLKWFNVNGLFLLAVACAGIALLVLYTFVPTPQQTLGRQSPQLSAFGAILANKQLGQINLGIFILHAVFTATFVVLPISLKNYLNLPADQQWSFIYQL